MNEATTKILAEQATDVAKEMAVALKRFSRETALLLYAKALCKMEIECVFVGDKVHPKMTNERANEKMNKTIEKAKIKWQNANDGDKQKVLEMQKIIQEGQERIKELYNQIV
ncbi:hypothetical protein [Niabella ginsengisoli]|uniref:Uncharacterized protein n=1 Tax=Niabella ginsengisoli TaxID=522298 RepID=A0ABS9SGR4_9BACT|nr:hypothetical protein [Niabella ginsengisoli]MCH5597556.1 hypothetical protein [Niabella ginsengisoli]